MDEPHIVVFTSLEQVEPWYMCWGCRWRASGVDWAAAARGEFPDYCPQCGHHAIEAIPCNFAVVCALCGGVDDRSDCVSIARDTPNEDPAGGVECHDCDEVIRPILRERKTL